MHSVAPPPSHPLQPDAVRVLAEDVHTVGPTVLHKCHDHLQPDEVHVLFSMLAPARLKSFTHPRAQLVLHGRGGESFGTVPLGLCPLAINSPPLAINSPPLAINSLCSPMKSMFKLKVYTGPEEERASGASGLSYAQSQCSGRSPPSSLSHLALQQRHAGPLDSPAPTPYTWCMAGALEEHELDVEDLVFYFILFYFILRAP
jgi:hypothetical protein